jgi:hypothetical protein
VPVNVIRILAVDSVEGVSDGFCEGQNRGDLDSFLKNGLNELYRVQMRRFTLTANVAAMVRAFH